MTTEHKPASPTVAMFAGREGLTEHIRIWAVSPEGHAALNATGDAIKMAIDRFEREMRLDPELMRKPVDF